MTIENRVAKLESLPAEVFEECKKCDVLVKGPFVTPRAGEGLPNLVSANSLLRRGLKLCLDHGGKNRGGQLPWGRLPTTAAAAICSVARGGVDVRQINPSTMASKCLPGLYFAGEVLDVDAQTGGFNLQIAFSTGALAGKSAAEGEN